LKAGDFTHSSVWLLLLDREGVVLEVSPAAAWAVPVGAPLSQAFPSQADALNAALQRAREAAPGAVIEVSAIRSGTPIWIHLTFSARTDPERIVVVGFDITSRKEAEERLRRSESLMVDAQGVAHLGTWEWDVSQPHASWSAELYRIYGLTPETYTPSYEEYLKKVHPDDRAHVQRATERVFKEHVPYSHDERIFRADGAVRYLHTWAYPVLDSAGALTRLVGVCQDITDQKHAQLELAQRLSELGEANTRLRNEMSAREMAERKLRQAYKLEAIGRLAGGIAHDFNNLLAVIVARSSIVIGGLPADSGQRESMDEIISTARNAARLTQQLLAFSRGQRVSLAVIDLRTVVLELTEIFRPALGTGIELVTTFEDSAPYVAGDRSQLDQVVMNLLVNAREAIPESGRITLAIGASDPTGRALPEDLDPKVPCVVLSVTDTGVGMDDAIQSRIFDPYFTTKSSGTGLGLSTSYGIVKQSGGVITVSSEPGRGSTVSVFLPRTRGPASEEDIAIPADLAAAAGKRVMLVEDQPALRRTTRSLLEAAGYSVIEAEGADEALAMAAGDPRAIDLLLTDIVMPKINGLELAGLIRKLRPEIRLLYVSGFADGVLISKAKDQAPLLTKPFTSQELAKAVAAALTVT
jgi:two-component system, cell cycle sensor histidine kinase and response regulator CckA